jgi:hypothetical protein
VLAGAALLETALIPGILIGGVAVLAPRYLAKGALPRLCRRVETLTGKTVHRQTTSDTFSPAAAAVRSGPKHPSQIRDWAGGRQNHHLPDDRHHARLHHQLCRDRRGRHGRGLVDLQSHSRAAVLSRARSGLELFRFGGRWR